MIRTRKSENRQAGFTVLELLVCLLIIGLLASLGLQSFASAVDQARLSRTMGDMKMVAQSILQAQIDEIEMPSGTVPVSELTDLLKTYHKSLPTHDGWGNPLIFVGNDGESADGIGPGGLLSPPAGPTGPNSAKAPDSAKSADSPKSPASGKSGQNWFQIRSNGKNGVPEADVATGVWVDYNTDIILESGVFIQTKW